MAQLEAARAQHAAEAACIGLVLDEEKITSLSASTRRHLQGLALVVQVGLPFGPLAFLCLCNADGLDSQVEGHWVPCSSTRSLASFI